ncbi:MAG: TetR/AcrR family transcriptional regulator [Acidimicrobiales bacterium]
MIHDSEGETEVETGVDRGGFRTRHRIARHRAYLEVALSIVSVEGLTALTMQRVAAELDCAVGAIYRYFPSKAALIGEVQREALAILHTSMLLGRARLDGLLADRAVDDATAALARVVGVSHWWAEAGDTFPQEVRLLHRLIADAETVLPPDEALRVLPGAMRLVETVRDSFDRAVEQGVLDPGDGMERTVIAASAITGLLMTSKLGRLDVDLFDGPRLARQAVRDLLLAWGAPPPTLAAAEELVAELARLGPMAPPVPRT